MPRSLRLALVLCASALAGSALAAEPAPPPDRDAIEARWAQAFDAEIARLQKKFTGIMAVYVSDPTLGVRYGYRADKPSYLASAVKLAFMIEVFRQRREGLLTLDEELTFTEEDIRDGAPKMNAKKMGAKVSIRELLELMMHHSDNAASDMLAHRVGLDNVSFGLRSQGYAGFTPLTSLLDVRRGVFREVDIRSDDLKPADIRAIRWITGWQAQTRKLEELLGRPQNTYGRDEIQAAFDRYYETGVNSARLDAVGAILEALNARKLINAEASEAMITLMRGAETSRRRILGRLPAGTKVAHKTGSQHERVCDIGLIDLPDGRPLVFAACMAGGHDVTLAEANIADLARKGYDLAIESHKSLH